jgi:hypothetical protein
LIGWHIEVIEISVQSIIMRIPHHIIIRYRFVDIFRLHCPSHVAQLFLQVPDSLQLCSVNIDELLGRLFLIL